MKKLGCMLVMFLAVQIVSGQAIVVGNYSVFGQKDYASSFRPEQQMRDIVDGFSIDFKFSAAMSSAGTGAVVLNDYKIDYSKGYFKKFGSEKTGKYYPCAILKGLCDNSKLLQALSIEINWEYNGVAYTSGGDMLIHKPRYVNTFSPPSEIGYQAVRDGKAKIISIVVKSCTVEKTDEINNLIYDLKSKK